MSRPRINVAASILLSVATASADPVEYVPRNDTDKVSLALEDVDLAELVRVIGQMTGKRFIFGGKVHNVKTSVFAPQKVTVAEAYQAFLSILETNGLTLVPHGRFLKIVETVNAATQTLPTYGSQDAVPTEDRYITRLLRLAHSRGDEVASVLGHFKSKDGDITPAGDLVIMTDTGANIHRMLQIVQELDVEVAGDKMWIEPIHYASAAELAPRISEAVVHLHVSKILADARSNSLIIIANEANYQRILELLKRLDLPLTTEGDVHVIALQHADAIELSKTLSELVQGAQVRNGTTPSATAIFEGAVKITADKPTNTLVVTSSLRDYAAVKAVAAQLDHPRRQVFIEAVIMDASVSNTRQFGTNFSIAGLTSGLTGSGQSLAYGGLNPIEAISPLGSDTSILQGLALGVRGPGIPGTSSLSTTGADIPAFSVLIQALAQSGDTDVISTPHILATDNVKAEISVGQNIALQQNLTSSSTSSSTSAVSSLGFTAGANPQRQDVGTKISLTPHLNESDEIRIELAEEVSEAGDAVGQLGVVPITKRTVTTTLVVKDKQTIIIGGLVRNHIGHSETKIPVLGDIPILGVLFRQTKNDVEKSNLLLVLTPYIIREQADLRSIFDRKMQERQEFLDRYFVFSDDQDYKPPKDYSRANGLLEDIKATYRALDEKERNEALLKPTVPMTHTTTAPLTTPLNITVVQQQRVVR